MFLLENEDSEPAGPQQQSNSAVGTGFGLRCNLCIDDADPDDVSEVFGRWSLL